ncbi:MAG: hypothetical protein EXR86_02335 [Gammaproteobacteria bacterium]|nr:hypothetical protein [Gammaproteobacteria bacterium]
MCERQLPPTTVFCTDGAASLDARAAGWPFRRRTLWHPASLTVGMMTDNFCGARRLRYLIGARPPGWSWSGTSIGVHTRRHAAMQGPGLKEG